MSDLAYADALLQVINAPDAPEKAAILATVQAPEPETTWDPPPLPQLPGRPAHYRISAKPPRRRRGLDDVTGRCQFLLAIHHIELSAIDLACVLCLRGSGMPRAFHEDFLQVAREECEHAILLDDLLSGRGHPPGSRAVHMRLWEAALACRDLGEQLVVIPRFLEARGLDVTAELLPRIEPLDPEAHRILTRIYEDERSHVSAGTRWHQWWCDHRGIPRPEHFIDRAGDHFADQIPSPQALDEAGRRAAGFLTPELDFLAGESTGG